MSISILFVVLALTLHCNAGYTWCKARGPNGHKCNHVASTTGNGYCNEHKYVFANARPNPNLPPKAPVVVAVNGNRKGMLPGIPLVYPGEQQEEERVAEIAAFQRQHENERLAAEESLRRAEQDKWYATQERMHAEQAAEENRRWQDKWIRDSDAELARQQEAARERERQDAEQRAMMFW